MKNTVGTIALQRRATGWWAAAIAAGWNLVLPLLLPAAPVASRPVAVTVYPDRAAVTRLAQIDVVPGEQVVELTNLPLLLTEASLQADGRGTSAVTIMELTSKVMPTPQTVHPQMRTLEAEKKQIEDALHELDEQTKLLTAETTSLNNMETALTQPGGKEAARPSFKDMCELLPFLSTQRKRIAQEVAGVEKQREPLRDKLRVVNEQLAQLRGTGAKAFRTVSVRLQAAAAGRFDLRVTYQVPQASWAPSYDARLRTATRALELSYFGSVRNGTGEDWPDVALTLSTAQPSQGGGAPEPRPWIVDVARPVAPLRAQADDKEMRLESFAVTTAANKRAKSAVSYGALPVPAAAAPEMIEASSLRVAQVDTALTSATFRLAAPITLASDNTAKKVPITQAQLPASLLYQATPKLRESAFLSAKVTNASDFPLLAGPVNVFLDDAFVATSRLKSVMSGEKFDLALGVDEGIALKRRLVNRFAEDTGLTNKGRRVTYEVLFTITNHKSTPERVELAEAVPVSRHEKIEVKLLTPSERDLGPVDSPKEIVRDVEGRLTWRLQLKPGEKRDVTLKFAVEYPADITVSGLE